MSTGTQLRESSEGFRIRPQKKDYLRKISFKRKNPSRGQLWYGYLSAAPTVCSSEIGDSVPISGKDSKNVPNPVFPGARL